MKDSLEYPPSNQPFEINGISVEISSKKDVTVYKPECCDSMDEFRDTVQKIGTYLILEGFVPKKDFRIRVIPKSFPEL